MQKEARETSGLPFQMVWQGKEIRFVATGSFGCVMLTAEGLAGLAELNNQADAWARMARANVEQSARLKAEGSVMVSEARRVARMCQGTFPHGVACLWHMLDKQIRGFCTVSGEDFERMTVDIGFLCKAMAYGFEKSDDSTVTSLEDMFKEILDILLTE